MNFDRHVTAPLADVFSSSSRAMTTMPAANPRPFYDEYSTVHGSAGRIPISRPSKRVFQRHDLAHGAFKVHGEPVDPGAIEQTALMTVEGERDDILRPWPDRLPRSFLCRNLPDKKKLHHLQLGVGHYGRLQRPPAGRPRRIPRSATSSAPSHSTTRRMG